MGGGGGIEVLGENIYLCNCKLAFFCRDFMLRINWINDVTSFQSFVIFLSKRTFLTKDLP